MALMDEEQAAGIDTEWGDANTETGTETVTPDQETVEETELQRKSLWKNRQQRSRKKISNLLQSPA